jgi:anthranilate synthase component 1
LAQHGNLVPVWREVVADMETPVSAFLKIARGSHSFLLESVEGGERLARYSFIGTEPYRTLRTGNDFPSVDPLPLVQEELGRFRPVSVPDLPRFLGGAVGYISYDAVGHFERLPTPPSDTLDLPEAVFMFADTVLVFDHLTHRIKVVSHAHLDEGVEEGYAAAVERIDGLLERLNGPVPGREAQSPDAVTSSVTSNFAQKDFEAMVERAKEDIFDGEILQVVLSQRLSRQTCAQPFDIYRAVRTINPSPYMYYLQMDDLHIIGASPEMLVRVEDGIVATHPIAGTRPRGATPEEDRRMEEELRSDEKECAEHIMLVDLGRNDIGRVSEPGTVEVTQLMDVERYSHVMHLVSHVEGKLRDDFTAADALRACFPAGTVSGAPKIRAMEIIAELEKDKRGPYAGAVGYFGFSGNMDTAITIRTIVMTDGVAHVQAGGGIVADSVPAREHEETMNKAGALLKAIQQAEEVEYAAPSR